MPDKFVIQIKRKNGEWLDSASYQPFDNEEDAAKEVLRVIQMKKKLDKAPVVLDKLTNKPKFRMTIPYDIQYIKKEPNASSKAKNVNEWRNMK